MNDAIDLHCHILPGVDDGAADWDASLGIAAALVQAGFAGVAPSPHYGEGPGGDVPIERAASLRAELAERLRDAGIPLQVLPNAEHHVTPLLFDRLSRGAAVPIGESRWLLVELPWAGLPDPEGILFRLQTKGYKLLLAHPERYRFLAPEMAGRLVARGVRMQLELGSFVGVYGERARTGAMTFVRAGWAHVLASDLHRAQDAPRWLAGGVREIESRYGAAELQRAVSNNPRQILADAAPDALQPIGD